MAFLRAVALLILAWLVPAPLLGQILSPDRAFGKYQQFTWQDHHGLPQNSVSAITRTRDGYLWLATLEGLARFDGVRFTVFNSGNTPAITTNLITAVIEDRAGGLWVGTDGGGLVRYLDGRFTRYTTQQGLANDHVMVLLQDRAGNLWAGTDGGGLTRFAGGRFTSYRTQDGLPNAHVWALAEGPGGTMWIGTDAGLARVEDGRFTIYTTRDGLPDDDVRSIDADAWGTLWIGTAAGRIGRFSDGRFTTLGAETGLPTARVSVLLRDRHGVLWIGTEAGLWRLEDGRVAPYTPRGGLPDRSIRSIYEDPDGDVWVGTGSGGLVQLRTPRFETLTVHEGLAGDYVSAVFEDRSGRLWISTDGGLSRLDSPGHITRIAIEGLPTSVMIRSITEDQAGSLWLGSRAGLFRWTNHHLTHWTTRDGLASNNVFTVVTARDGTIWIGTLSGGLSRFRDGHFNTYTTRDGLPDDDIISLHEDRAGRLWIGTRSGGVARLGPNGFTTWSTRDGLGNNHVLSFHEDGRGAIWIATHGGGLARFQNDRLTTVSSRNGLYDNLAFAMLEDNQGNVWMSGNRGIYRARLDDLNDVADGRQATMSSFAYGVADGMLSRECNGASPAGWKTRDGRIWFPTVKGLVAIDATRHDARPPLIAIETVSIDRTPLPPGQPVRLSPQQHDLEITYTALSWRRSNQTRFKYRLAGLDDGWIDAGARRAAVFSRLPPGSYTFTVIADNGEGVWNTGGQSLSIMVVPAFYQTRLFLTLTSLLVAGLLALVWHYRVRQLQRAQNAHRAFSARLIASQEGERKRIAAELHDGLGQSLLVIKNQAAFAAMREPDSSARARLGDISQLAARTIDEVREISWNLRPSHLDQLGLRTALIVMTERMADAGDVAIDHEIDDLHGLLSSEREITVYRIVQECLNNVVKHARARRAIVTVRRRERTLEIRVHDDGRGLSGTTPAATPENGFGLTGVSERVRMLAGTHSLTSTPGRGTTITVKVPISRDTQGGHHE